MSGWGLSHVGEDYESDRVKLTKIDKVQLIIGAVFAVAFLWTADFWGQQIAFALLDISGVPR